MLIKRVGNAAKRVMQVVVWNVLHRKPIIYSSLPRIFKNAYRLDILRRPGISLARNPIYRIIQLSLRNGRSVRPLSSLAINHRRFHNDRIHNTRFNAFVIKKRSNSGLIEKIRDVFSSSIRYNVGLLNETFPNTIDAYEIGQNIGYGCNAAVYALRIRDSENPSYAHECSKHMCNRHSPQQQYPLALKLMYNFAFDIPPHLGDNYLWRSMGAELVPFPGSADMLRGKMGSFRPLPTSHPNVVQILTAFVDRMPILDDAKLLYPDALPSASFYDIIIDEPRTMFVVMKRYHMTLRDYVKDFSRKRSYHVARVLFGQLLEGCVFLYENMVSQRDMKSDNILLEFNVPDEIPHLVISDFGCALATGSWFVKYVDDTIDLGGNVKMRAPEIILASCGIDSIVDFRMADTWAAGALGYEIFTRVNPFYTRMSNATYKEEDLPRLPFVIGKPISDVLHHLLRRDPTKRLLPHIAANVVILSLLRLGGNFQTFLSSFGLPFVLSAIGNNSIAKKLFEQINFVPHLNLSIIGVENLGITADKLIEDVVFLISAETIATHASTTQVISRAEQQLRATFLSRLDRRHIWEAFSYFLPLNTIQCRKQFGSVCGTSLWNAIKTNSLYPTNGIISRSRALVPS
ncbi:hypothetical protein DICVIV_01726 [Dictyocaulus viviparus]|uniref:non-specific serine/threonine protein kinase n=1 Tax=Dictyocaulus viviparus TaxID=29172 RepID=A0A0D8Y5L3_DICVI|nr:hypothetical protein DICVIV_01726 [Dictyocaulus viviparus]